MYTLPLRDYLDTAKGVTACVSSWRRVSENMIPARAKPTGVYLNSALARDEAKRPLLAAAADEDARPAGLNRARPVERGVDPFLDLGKETHENMKHVL